MENSINVQPEKYDSKGNSLNSYPRGEYLNSNGYWLIGTGSQHSWDSRYWGPVTDEQILLKVKPLLVLNKQI